MIATSPWRNNLILAIALVLGFWLTGCTEKSTAPTDPANEAAQTTEQTAETDGKKKVLVTFSVLADIAKNVAGDQLIVESITKIGTEIHGYEPTPSDLVKAQDADLILYNGLNLERWFEQFLGNLKDVPSVTLTTGIEPIAIAEGNYADKPNPHAWMSPKNALIYVENIRQAFVELDPENAEIYNTNAKVYSEKIQAIADQLEKNLASVPENQRYLVTCEGAFSYLARDYDLKEIYIWAINAEQQFTPKQVQQVIEKVKTNNIPTIFCESTVSDKGQREVAKSSGATFGGNLYVDSLSNTDGEVPTFLKLLEYDTNLIANGLLNKSQVPPSPE